MTNYDYVKHQENLKRSGTAKLWESSISYRELLWLVQHLQDENHGYIKLLEIGDEPSLLKKEVFNYLTLNDIDVDELIAKCRRSIIPDDNFNWIDQYNLRQLLFLHHLLYRDRFYDLSILIQKNPRLDSKILYRAILYELTVTIKYTNDQYEKVANLQDDWNASSTPEKYIKWVLKKNKEQLFWLKNYLSTQNKFRGLENFHEDHQYQILLLCIDLLYFRRRNKDEFELLFSRMKRSWSQQKFRLSGNESKKYHIPLTKKGKERLLKLVEFYNEKEHILLERLINQEYEKEMTDENGKDKY